MQRVSISLIKVLLDDLWQQKVFNTEEKDSVMEEQRSRADQARCLIDMVISKGKRSSQMMIDSMKERDEQLCINMGLISSSSGVGELLPLIYFLKKERGASLSFNPLGSRDSLSSTRDCICVEYNLPFLRGRGFT